MYAPRGLCCGRSFLSVGLAGEAKREARKLLQALSPYAARGVPVVGLEPSCLVSLRDEFGVLLPKGDRLAKNAFLFEEFLARNPGKLKLKEMKGEAL